MPPYKLDAEALKAFGDDLGRLRRHADLNVSEAARKLGVDRGAIERWENGVKVDDPPKRRGLALGMAELAGVDATDWFDQPYTPDLSARVAALEEAARQLRAHALAEDEEEREFREQLERGAAFAPLPAPTSERPEDQTSEGGNG